MPNSLHAAHQQSFCLAAANGRHGICHRCTGTFPAAGWVGLLYGKLSDMPTGYLSEEGQLWLMGRNKDTIRTGSETVHASEVERCLQLHPAVAAAAVVGLPDAQFGEQVSPCLHATLALTHLSYPI